MPEFTASDKAMIEKYVNERLANGDRATAVMRDLANHWRTMDAQSAANAPTAPTAPEQPTNADGFPVDERGTRPAFVNGGGSPELSVSHTVPDITSWDADRPLTLAEVQANRSRGESWEQIAAKMRRTGRS